MPVARRARARCRSAIAASIRPRSTATKNRSVLRSLRPPCRAATCMSRQKPGDRTSATTPSATQVALKWLLEQDGVAAIPKASRLESQQANLDALKITLDDADRNKIAAQPKDRRCVNPGFAPAWD